MKSINGVCYIFGAGEYCADDIGIGNEILKNESDFIIAADGGYLFLQSIGVEPDFIVGDFDSSPMPKKGNIIKLEKEKDDTDTLFAVKMGLERGYKVFRLFGCTGGDISHTLANIQILAYITESGAAGYLYGDGYAMTVIKDGSIEFGAEMSGRISVFAHSEKAYGVCEEGLKYKLENATLSNSFPQGVSNEFTGEKSRISVEEGIVLLVSDMRFFLCPI